MKPLVFEFESVILQSLAAGVRPAGIFYVKEYAAAVAVDLANLTLEPAQADDFFDRHRIPQNLISQGNPQQAVEAWEKLLGVLNAADPAKYAAIHKGTPFYFLAIACYLMEDFERALFFLDSAIEEDVRIHGDRWIAVPSGLFIRLDAATEQQAAQPLVADARAQLTDALAYVQTLGGPAVTVDQIHDKFLQPAVIASPDLRPLVTAFFTFVLEFNTRVGQLMLSPGRGGTGESVFVHLFKGALLFESLIKVSALGKAVAPKTLGDALGDQRIWSTLQLAKAPQGFAHATFGDVMSWAISQSNANAPFAEMAVRTTWGIRNTTGHNLAWPSKPLPPEYMVLFGLILGAGLLAIEQLL